MTRIFPTPGDVAACAGWLLFAGLLAWLRYEQWRADRAEQIRAARRPLCDRWAEERR